MSDRNPGTSEVVGQEGLAPTLAALSSQVSAIEKASISQLSAFNLALNERLDAAREIAQTEHTAIRREMEIEREHLRMHTDDEARSLRTEMKLEIEKVGQGLNLELISVRREIKALVDMQQATAVEHWHSHNALHNAQDRSDDAANDALEKRLGILNNERSQTRDFVSNLATKEGLDKSIGSLSESVGNEKADSRRRFEQVESRMNEMEKTFGRELRQEVRPVQDARVGQSAIWAAVGGIALLVGLLISIIGLASRFMGG